MTAATGALSQSIAENLCQNGCNLILAGRNPEKLLALQKTLQKKYATALSILQIEYDDGESIQRASRTLMPSSLGGIVLITPRPFLRETSLPTPDEWATAFSQTFIYPLEMIRQFSSKITPYGSIVTLSGLTSKVYMPTYPHTNVIRIAWSGEFAVFCATSYSRQRSFTRRSPHRS